MSLLDPQTNNSVPKATHLQVIDGRQLHVVHLVVGVPLMVPLPESVCVCDSAQSLASVTLTMNVAFLALSGESQHITQQHSIACRSAHMCLMAHTHFASNSSGATQ